MKVKVSIFQIPAFQIFVGNEPALTEKEAEARGIRGTQTGGNITSSFPDGVVSVETDIFQNNKEVYSVIKEKIRFPDMVRILSIGNICFLVNAENLEASVIDEEMYPSEHKHLMKEFALHFTPISIEDDEVIINVKFSKTLLVGFPTNEGAGRGTVYWLAFTIEN